MERFVTVPVVQEDEVPAAPWGSPAHAGVEGMHRVLILPLNTGDAPLATAGGKGANLARLARAGFPVPEGCIITTHAYHAYLSANQLQGFISATVHALPSDNPAALATASDAIQARFAAGVVPSGLADAVHAAYAALGGLPVAIRSSATTEDLPEMSFAGQQATYLNIIGEEALPDALKNCWSRSWAVRSLSYRAHHHIALDEGAFAVVVQTMLASEISGILFTANPLSGRRDEIVIDASFGLGEALVSRSGRARSLSRELARMAYHRTPPGHQRAGSLPPAGRRHRASPMQCGASASTAG
jgi:pyruvate,water dikinase